LPGALRHRGVEVEGDEPQQFPIAHFGQINLPARAEKIVRQLPFRIDQQVDFSLDRSPAHELMHEHVALLPNSVGAVGRLVFDRRVPPAIEMHDMRGAGQV